MRYKLRPYDVNKRSYTHTNAEGKKYYFRESTLKFNVYVGREIRSGKYRHVFINKSGVSITVHVKSAATTKKKELSLSGALCRTVAL